jgi:E3 ubiquitin-protein ligase XIAP
MSSTENIHVFDNAEDALGFLGIWRSTLEDTDGSDDGYDTTSPIGVAIQRKHTGRLPDTNGIIAKTKPVYPNYTLVENRRSSFRDWSIGFKLTPKELSDGGFFYTGRSDCCICFQCGLGLRDWSPEDSVHVEHAKYSPHCSHLLLLKGSDFVNTVLQQNDNDKGCQTESTMDEQNNTPNHLLCKICLTDELAIAALPCGHLMSCINCVASIEKCAICRQEIVSNVRIFLS